MRNKEIYVRLLGEDIEVMRPVRAEQVTNDVYRLLPDDSYDASVEKWEFPPGSLVRCIDQSRENEVIQIASHQATM